jgi:hypothetical protein
VRRAEGYEDELARARELVGASLIDVLQRGHAAGVLRSDDPEQDAATLLAIVIAAVDRLGGRRFDDRAEARAHIVRFWWPALAISTPR